MLEIVKEYLYVFFCAMVPLIELRGSVIIGAGMGMPWFANLVLSVIGNMLPVPFILLFIRKILAWMHNTKHFKGFAQWLEKKAHSKSDRVLRYASLGLVLFVGIPLPGTGAWTGALIASLLGIKFKKAFPAIVVGIIIATIIMSLVSYGLLGAIIR